MDIKNFSGYRPFSDNISEFKIRFQQTLEPDLIPNPSTSLIAPAHSPELAYPDDKKRNKVVRS